MATGASSFEVSGGASLTMPLASYADGANYPILLQASGTGSVLSFPKLATVTLNGASYDAVAQIQALSGGDVELPGLTQLSGGPVQLESDGTGSKLNISGVTSFTQTSGLEYASSSLQATHGGTVSDAKLTSLENVDLTLDGTGTIATSQITSYTADTNRAGILTLSGGSLDLTGLSDGDGASFEVSGGASLTMPLASYADGANYPILLQASGTGSVLSFPKLATVTLNGASYDAVAQIQALSGGDVELPGLTQLSGGPVQLESDGTGSKLNISGVTSFQQTSGFYAFSSLQATKGGTVSDAKLTSLKDVDLTLDGTGTIATSQITSYTADTNRAGILTLGRQPRSDGTERWRRRQLRGQWWGVIDHAAGQLR